jgi:hypothetical protein
VTGRALVQRLHRLEGRNRAHSARARISAAPYGEGLTTPEPEREMTEEEWVAAYCRAAPAGEETSP